MPFRLTTHDQQLIEELYKENSKNPSLRCALRHFRREGAKEEFVCDMLTGFRDIQPRYILRKNLVFFRGQGLERLYIHCLPNKRAAVIVHRQVVAKFDVPNDPREREALVRWLWKYSAKERKRAAAKVTNESLSLHATRAEEQGRHIQNKEAESLTPEKEANTLTALWLRYNVKGCHAAS